MQYVQSYDITAKDAEKVMQWLLANPTVSVVELGAVEISWYNPKGVPLQPLVIFNEDNGKRLYRAASCICRHLGIKPINGIETVEQFSQQVQARMAKAVGLVTEVQTSINLEDLEDL